MHNAEKIKDKYAGKKKQLIKKKIYILLLY